MDSENKQILELLDKWMNHIDINASTGGAGVGVGKNDLEPFEEKWKGQLNEFASWIDGMDVFVGGRMLRLRMVCV